MDGIPVTTAARTLFDLAEVVDESKVELAFEEADRLGLLRMRELEAVCARGHGRRALRVIRPLIEAARLPDTTRSPLEDLFQRFCREHGLPPPQTNVLVLSYEVDVYWPDARLIVEIDSWSFHHHRAAFERDRARDAAMQAEGFRVVRVTYRRLEQEPRAVASELRSLMDVPVLGGHYRSSTTGTSERGQGTVEWVGLVAVVALMMAGLLAAGVRVPGTALAREVASRLLCAASLADSCGDEPALIAAYGTEVGKLVREHMPAIFLERGSRALPVDFRRCRSSACGDGTRHGLVHRTDSGAPVTAFVHVVDCRPRAESVQVAHRNCSGPRAGNLYVQYWLYYADSATLRGVPIAGARGYHRDDWESVQIRIGPDGEAAERASSHHGYNHGQGAHNWGTDAGLGPLGDAAEAIGLRPPNGWGTETHALLVSGGSHAGNTDGIPRADRLVPGRRVHLVPLEGIAPTTPTRFAVTPPWRKRVWHDPEADGTN